MGTRRSIRRNTTLLRFGDRRPRRRASVLTGQPAEGLQVLLAATISDAFSEAGVTLQQRLVVAPIKQTRASTFCAVPRLEGSPPKRRCPISWATCGRRSSG